MTIVQMLEQSGVLTVLGMGVVFGFLVIMVICVSIMGKIFKAFGVIKGVDTDSSVEVSIPGNSASVTAAITAAVTEYQRDNN